MADNFFDLQNQDPNTSFLEPRTNTAPSAKAVENKVAMVDKVAEPMEDVGIISSDDGVDAVNQGREFLDQVAPAYTSEQYDKDLAAEKASKAEGVVEEEVKEEEAAGKSFDFEDLLEMGIKDFSNFTQTADGKFKPNAQGFEDIGVSGVEDEKQNQLEAEVEETNARIEGLVNDFDSYNVDQDPAYNTFASNIRAEYDKMRRNMEDKNRRRQRALETMGLRTGVSQYAGSVGSGIISEEITQANERIGDIVRQEQQAIAGARSAFESNSYTKFSQKVDALKTLREGKADALKNYNDKLVEANKAMQEEEKFELEVAKFQLDIMNKSKTPEIKEYEFAKTQGFVGDILDYKLYKEEIKKTTEGINQLGNTLSPQEKSEANFLAKTLYGSSAIKTEHGYNMLVGPIIERMANGESIDAISDSLRFKGQSPEFTGTIREAAQQITSKLSTTKSEAVFDKLDDLLATNDIQKVRDFIKKIAVENSAGGAEQAKMITGQERTVEFLDEIHDDLKAYEKAGGKTNIFTGTMEEIAKKVGTVKDAELRGIAAKILKARQQYRRAMTGVAFSPGENLEYDAIFPSISKTAEFNTATIESLQEAFRGDVDFFYGFQMGNDAYQELFKNEGGFKSGTQETENIDFGGELENAINAGRIEKTEFDDLIKELNSKGLYYNNGFTEEDVYQYFKDIGKISFSQGGTVPNAGANIPQQNLNPGNIKKGGLADKYAKKDASGKPITDEQNHLVFATAFDGMKALRDDVKAKISGRSKWIKSNNPTIRELGKVYAEDPNWPISVAKILGVSPDAKTQSIDFEKLINAVATQEGYFA